MATTVIEERTALTHAGLTAGACRRCGPAERVDGEHHCGRGRGSRRRSVDRKHASARRGFCRDRGRAIEAAKPLRGSGVGPISHQRSVRSSSFYDPTTGQFLSRDPANTFTRNPYGYVYSSPHNGTDPSGLLGLPFGFCVKTSADDTSCDTAVTYQQAADVSSGVLNGLLLGHGAGVTEALPFTRGKTNYNSAAYGTGTIIGTAPYVVAGAGGAGAGASEAALSESGVTFVGRATAVSAVGNVYNDCKTLDSGCAYSVTVNVGTLGLGIYGSIASNRVATVVGVGANYLPPSALQNALESRAHAEDCGTGG